MHHMHVYALSTNVVMLVSSFPAQDPRAQSTAAAAERVAQ